MSRRLLLGCLSIVGLTTSACSALVSPDGSRLGGGLDGGGSRDDAAVLDRDVYVPPGTDAAIPPEPDAALPPGTDAARPPGTDAGRPVEPDAAGSCAEGSARCDGELRVVCRGGVESIEDCTLSRAYCEAGGCRTWACEPGSAFCSRDGTGVVTCDDRGTALSFTDCASGCDRSTNACAAGVSCPDLPTVAVGDTRTIDLCAGPGDTSYVPGPGCGMTTASSADHTFALTIASTTTILVDLRDVDPTVGIDTVVYLRRACDDPASQLACDDDVRCSESDITTGCTDGVQVRQSRFTITLEPGTYYLVADAFRYGSFDCGEVELRITTP